MEFINLLWKKGNEALLKSKNIQVVFYEDIIGNPRKTIKTITNFLGIPFEEGLLNIQDSDWEMPAFKSDEGYWYTKEQLKGVIRKDAVEKWLTVLTAYDLFLIDRHLMRIPALTDRYRLEVTGSLRLIMQDYIGTCWAQLRKLLMKAGAKLYRLI